MRSAAIFALAVVLAPGLAFADGKRDLEDGIAFYENLDIERAQERLTAASTNNELAPPQRARAFLYLGMLQFELGNKPQADTAFARALRLDPKVRAPSGTSPKTIAALEKVRSGVLTSEPGGIKPSPPPPPPPPPPPVDVPPPPDLDVPPPPPPDTTTTVTELPPESEGVSGWVWVGVGVGVAAAATVVVILLASGANSDCAMGGGGCINVTFE